MMKAIVYNRKLPEKLVLRELEEPVPGKGEVLLRVRACSINAADYRSMKLGIPAKHGVYGADMAGTVVAVGEEVTRFSVGDHVMGDLTLSRFGGFAEYTTAPEAVLAKKPEDMPFETAATISLAGVTALQAVRLGGEIQPCQRVLIFGAGGGVGTFAIQLSKFFGAEVTAVCGAQNLEQSLTLGADRAMDYRREDCLDGRVKYDRILAINGERALRQYYSALKPGGIAVIVGGSLKQVFGAMAFGFLYAGDGRQIRLLAAKTSAADAAYLAELVERGRIKPVIERIVPLAKITEAFAYVSAGHAKGKVVLVMP
ncbi:MAG: NAD(P)-dependent alcohol dehydrogenase [Eubacteriales bacterium]|nr:NAD(P)-dependent alcohol dehydrogenase [Eubacteriales bacterium]